MILPSVLVTDTNIWIDLENGKILGEIFRLPYQFVATDFAVEELLYPGWNTLHELGLITHNLEPESVLELAQLRQTYHQLSVVDLAALLLAKALGARLLTGDRRLNDLAREHGVSVHGMLWILDEMINHRILTANQAATALRKILDQGARLPNIECQKRFERWS